VNRRKFITLLGGASVAWPLAARAQQAAMPVVGLVVAASPTPYAARVNAFQKGMSEAGYVEGRNVVIEYRWTYDQNDRLPRLVADLIDRKAAVIVAGGTRSALAAKAATSTTPIVFYTVTNPVEAGLVAALNEPGGNLTGVTSLGAEVGPKRLQLLHELLPNSKNISLLVNPRFPGAETQSRDMQEAARALGLQLHVLNVSTPPEIDDAIANAVKLKAGGIVISTDPLFTARTEQLATMALRNAIPAIFQYREFASAGGLMSYGESFTEPYRQLGIYAGRILAGTKPADLPVQQATKFELVINLKTAKALGLEIPPPLFARADEVIE
jgi:putative ABC transport system substrate-binding protein